MGCRPLDADDEESSTRWRCSGATMKRSLKVAALLIVLWAPALAFTGQSPSKNPSRARKTLLMRERAFHRALIRKDTQALDRILGDDYLGTSSGGKVGNKAEFLENIRSSDFIYDRMESSDVSIRVYPHAAVVIGQASVTGHVRGKDISGQYRFTNVYVERGSRWELIAHQATPVAR